MLANPSNARRKSAVYAATVSSLSLRLSKQALSARVATASTADCTLPSSALPSSGGGAAAAAAAATGGAGGGGAGGAHAYGL